MGRDRSARRARHPKVEAFLGFVACAMLVGGGLYLLFDAYRTLRLVGARAVTTCTVVSSGVHTSIGSDDSKSRPYSAEIAFTFDHAGERIEATDRGSSYEGFQVAYNEAARFTPGESVACRYVEGSPSLAAVFPKRAEDATVPGVFGAFLVLAGVGIVGWERWKKRR